ncbi:MAG: hypothetical protein EON88_26695, partial [Brevundimonas sp.]
MAAGSDDQDQGGVKPQELSLDPSTWIKGEAASKASLPSLDADSVKPDAPADSYDPSTWMKGGTSKAPAPTPEPSVVAKPASPPSRRLLLVGGGAAGLIVLGGAGLLLTRKPKGAVAPAATSNTEKQVVTLPNLAALAPALTAYGLTGEEAGKISAAAGSFLPPAASAAELRLELELARAKDKASLVTLALSRPDGSGVRVTPAASGFTAAQLAATTRKQVKVARGQMDSESFYSSAVSAGLSDVLIPDFFQAFVYDFDFQREIEPGDAFEGAFEETVNERAFKG